MLSSTEINEIAAALAKAQGLIKNPVKTRTNPHFRSTYADLATGLDCIRSALSANGIAIVQATDIIQDVVVLETRLVHTSGQYVGCIYPVAPITMDHQKLGAALTYAKRQSGFSLVGVAGEDDDLDGEDAKFNRNGKENESESKLDESVRVYIDRAKETIAAFQTSSELKAWWDNQKDIRAKLDLVNTTNGPKPGYKQLFEAYSAKGKAVSEKI